MGKLNQKIYVMLSQSRHVNQQCLRISAHAELCVVIKWNLDKPFSKLICHNAI